ncbi:hypothetical protein [Liquorilactobacillus mali]|uniref:Uncharacterized protein n=1 Tax=Liquorilactobacillus mali KCTC 3596 = DSM 20444 TaxID=1046596 RepID=A0A0R2E9D5_9LACO|nr:hypothetical protein [Liquorilactobacillus mali]KRN09351.1 hypothetical protein FD00_GL001074 [Liquorilactobacillus mali KCTC 3596 = DSM 20444]
MSKVVDLNGTKFEVEDTKIKKVTEYRIGDTVKILDNRYSNPEISDGIIVDFLNFKSLPTVRIAQISNSNFSSSIDVSFISINSKTKEIEIMPISPDEMKIDVTLMNELFDSKIATKLRELDELKHKKNFFNKFFGQSEEAIDKIVEDAFETEEDR